MVDGFAHANGIRLHYVEEGPKDGPLVLLLHGFPEFWYSWRHQLPALAARGLRVVAPDLRGYGQSDKPDGVAAYDIDELAKDVVDLAQALGHERCAIVGHDWGGVVAWHTAMFHPDRVTRLAILDAPHPTAMSRELLRNRAQRRRSWYFFFFQVPFVPESRLAGEGLRGWIRGWGGQLSDDDLARYVATFPDRASLTPPIHYYRAAFRRWPRAMLRKPPRISAPTLVMWGAEDRILGLELVAGLERYLSGPLRVEIIANAGHFVQQDAPAEVSRLLAEFLC